MRKRKSQNQQKEIQQQNKHIKEKEICKEIGKNYTRDRQGLYKRQARTIQETKP
jgi:hypothetical protein